MSFDLMALDYDLVQRIAETELHRLDCVDWTPFDDCRMSAPVAACYLESYLTDRANIADPIMVNAFEKFDRSPITIQGTSRTWPAEFVAGHALAVAARNHACADLGRGLDGFAEHAVDAACTGATGPLDHAGVILPYREQGVDVDREIRSEQFITARQVMSCMAGIDIEPPDPETLTEPAEPRSAGDILTPADAEDIAQRLMASFRERDLDYDDERDVDVHIVDLLELRGIPRDKILY